jgi:hypothetical protein
MFHSCMPQQSLPLAPKGKADKSILRTVLATPSILFG